MTLEDFFTLTEMTYGLTAPYRVHELVDVMQKEKDCVVKHIGDATRQWAAVASTIAATENKDCLDLFIQLDGLWFIDRWLKDAQNSCNDASDGFVEESITALLRALEKLQIDKERSVSSGIWITVNNLLGHNSPRVQDRARALFDSWKQGNVGNSSQHDAEAFHDTSVVTNECNKVECVTVDIPPLKGSADVQSNAAEPASNEISQSRSTDLNPKKAESVQIETDNKKPFPHIIVEHGNLEDRSVEHLTACITSNSVHGSPLLKEKYPVSAMEATTSTEIRSFPVQKGHDSEPESDVLGKLSSFSDKSGVTGSALSKGEPETNSSSGDAASAQDTVTESALQNNVDVKEGDFCLNTIVVDDKGIPISVKKVGTDDVGGSSHLNTQELKPTSEDGECCSDTLNVLSGNEVRLQKPEDIGSPFSQIDGMGVSDDDRDDSSDGDDDLRDQSGFSKPNMDTRSPDLADRRKSDIELEFGIVDALEVARQVAQEVEREVVDYREPSCSTSSEKIMKSGIGQPGSPDSINAKQDPLTEVPLGDVSTGQNQPAEVYPEEGRIINSDKVENKVENGTHELESSQVTDVAQEPEVNTEKGLCDFDLNQEVCSDEMDHPMNPISTSISVVSASRLAAASGSPMAPLQFEGTLGWQGSAATSAFRPASPRKISDGDKSRETGGTSNNSKQRQHCLDIDLNVAEDDEVMGLMSARRIPVSSGPNSGESSLDVGPRKSERPNLDLNCISDDGDASPLDLRMEGQILFLRNGHRSPSPASSSSSMQPSLRNFDLNDRPLFCNDSSDQGPYHGKSFQNASTSGGSNAGDPVISIMGTRVEVGGRVEAGRKDFLIRTPSLPNGKPLDPIMDANVARMRHPLGMVPAVSYTNSPGFGYNGLTTGPTMSISSALYGTGGSIPYMVDSRGAPVVPQIMGPAPAVSPPYSQQPFIMSLSGTPLALNGAGPSRPNLDLNSGFAIDGGSTGLRQFFMPGLVRPVEEHLRANSQPSSSSGVVGKRKEPDGGWEPYPLLYKHPQPPWK